MRDPRQQLQRTSNRQTEKPARQQRRGDRQFSCRFTRGFPSPSLLARDHGYRASAARVMSCAGATAMEN